MQELVVYIVKNLVANPDAVVIREVDAEEETLYEVTVDPSDMGKVIGRQGRIAKALRTVVKAAAMVAGKRVSVKICE